MVKLNYTLRDSTQYETVYVVDNKGKETPILTIRRKHAFDNRSDAYWKVFDTHGHCVISLFLNNTTYLHKRITRWAQKAGWDVEVTTADQHYREWNDDQG